MSIYLRGGSNFPVLGVVGDVVAADGAPLTVTGQQATGGAVGVVFDCPAGYSNAAGDKIASFRMGGLEKLAFYPDGTFGFSGGLTAPTVTASLASLTLAGISAASGTSVSTILDTPAGYGAGDLITSFRMGGVQKAKVDYLGTGTFVGLVSPSVSASAASSLTIKGTQATSGSAVSVIVDSPASYTTGDLLQSWRMNTGQVASIDYAGAITGTKHVGPLEAAGTSQLVLTSKIATTGSAVAFKLVGDTGLTTGDHFMDLVVGTTVKSYFLAATGAFIGAVTGNTAGTHTGDVNGTASTTLSLTGKAAASGSAVGVVIDTPVSYASGDKILSIRMGTAEKASVDYAGSMTLAGDMYTDRILAGTSLPLRLSGKVTSSSSSIAVKIGNYYTSTVAGAKTLAIYSDNMATEVAAFGKAGSIALGWGAPFILQPQECIPGPCVAGTPTSGGSVTAGLHSYKYTFVTLEGESVPTLTSNVVDTTTNKTVPLTLILPGSSRCVARKIYRTDAGDTGNYKLIATIADNTTTTYSDTAADGVGAAAPTVNTTANVFIAAIADSATAIGMVVDVNSLTTAGSKLQSWQNNHVEKCYIDYLGAFHGNVTGALTGNASTATAAAGLTSATTTVAVSAATAPSAGQVLTASAGTAAGWVTPAGGYIDTTVSTTQMAAGLDLVADAAVPSGKKIVVDFFSMQVSSTVAWDGTLTVVTLQDKNSSPVLFATVTKAGLGASAIVLPWTATVLTLGQGFYTGGTAGKGLKIIADGTCTAGSTINLRVVYHFA